MATAFQNGLDGAPFDKNRSEKISGNKTLVAADTGKTFQVRSGTSIFTLPSTVVGLIYTFQYVGEDGDGQIQVSPAAADGIAAAGSAVADKDLILASGTIKRGDYVSIISGTGVAGDPAWTMTQQRGVVTKEA